MSSGSGLCYLDRARMSLGGDAFRQWFRNYAGREPRQAIRALNDRALLFPSLFILLPEIDRLGISPYMDQQYVSACRFCDTIITGDKKAFAQYRDRIRAMEHRALKWIFMTGSDWDSPSESTDQYDAVMDAAAALLIVVHGDSSILPAAADLIFRRNRKGLLVHDLIWSYFQACEPDSLRHIATWLLSEDGSDRELACRILCLPFYGSYDRSAAQGQYDSYMKWLDENNGCLCFTGEHFQMTSEPEPVRVHLEARYLRKMVSPKDGKWLEPLTAEEREKLSRFTDMPDSEREALAAYSFRLYRSGSRSWRQWMRSECEDQLRIALSDMEASNGHH